MKFRGITRFFQSFRNIIRRLRRHQNSREPSPAPPLEGSPKTDKKVTTDCSDLNDVKSQDILQNAHYKDKIRIKPKKNHPKTHAKPDAYDTVSVASCEVVDSNVPSKKPPSKVALKVPNKFTESKKVDLLDGQEIVDTADSNGSSDKPPESKVSPGVPEKTLEVKDSPPDDSCDIVDSSVSSDNRLSEAGIVAKVPETTLETKNVLGEDEADHDNPDGRSEDQEKICVSSNASLSSSMSRKSSDASDVKQSPKCDSKKSMGRSATSVSSSNNFHASSEKTTSSTNSEANLFLSPPASGKALKPLPGKNRKKVVLSSKSLRLAPTDVKPRTTQSCKDDTSIKLYSLGSEAPKSDSDSKGSIGDSDPIVEGQEEVNNNDFSDGQLKNEVFEDNKPPERNIQDLKIAKENHDSSSASPKIGKTLEGETDSQPEKVESSSSSQPSPLPRQSDSETAGGDSKAKAKVSITSDLPSSPDKSRSKVPPAVPTKPKTSRL